MHKYSTTQSIPQNQCYLRNLPSFIVDIFPIAITPEPSNNNNAKTFIIVEIQILNDVKEFL